MENKQNSNVMRELEQTNETENKHYTGASKGIHKQ